MATVTKIINAASLKDGKYVPIATDKDKRLLFTVSATVILSRAGLAINEGFVATIWADGVKVFFADNSETGDIRAADSKFTLTGKYNSCAAERIDKDNFLITGNLI